MAIKQFIYRDDTGSNSYVIGVEEEIMGIYPSLVSTRTQDTIGSAGSPTAYDDVAAAIAAVPAALQNANFTPRSLTLQIEGFGTARMPVLDAKASLVTAHINGDDWGATLLTQGLTGATPFPTPGTAEGGLTVEIVAFNGESRNSN